MMTGCEISHGENKAVEIASGEQINVALRNHQANAKTWNFQPVASDLHKWAERYIFEFKLQIGVPALLIERLKGRYGHFRGGRNGFGIVDEIGIDESHVRQSPYWRVCGTLLHELLHAWQEHHGKPGRRNYHNDQFRKKALALGLQIDQRGFTQYIPGDTPFLALLKKYGIVPVNIPASLPSLASRIGSKLKLYECPCGIKVRIGRSTFHACCLDCGGIFVEKETLNKSTL